MSTQPRKPAPRLARPAQRYWKGKAPKGVVEAASESESEEGDEREEQIPGDVPFDGDEEDDDEVGVPKELKGAGTKSMNVALRDVKLEGGKVIVGGRMESGRTEMEDEEEDESEEEEEAGVKVRLPRTAEDDGSSSEEESEDEDDVKPVPLYRPVFIPKRGRETVAEREADSMNSEEMIKKKEAEAEQRRKDSHDLVAESIKKELAEKETQELIPDVDDTDGLDPTGEFEAWRLRELGRVKREKEAEAQREEERLELERRRAMPEAERLKEDLEKAQKSREEKPKGQQKFLQKYWHKGAFHQDADILKKHDYTEATESTVDVSLLPQVMQVKNFGKRSQTKYTHLLDQDTTAKSGGFGGLGKGGPGQAITCFNCGGPHLKKDCPQLASGSNSVGTGPNSRPVDAPTGPRKWGINREVEPGKTWRDRDGRESGPSRTDDYPRRPRDDDRYYEKSSNSRPRKDPNDRNGHYDRTPPRPADRSHGDRRRSRSRSRSPERRHRDKRRRDD